MLRREINKQAIQQPTPHLDTICIMICTCISWYKVTCVDERYLWKKCKMRYNAKKNLKQHLQWIRLTDVDNFILPVRQQNTAQEPIVRGTKKAIFVYSQELIGNRGSCEIFSSFTPSYNLIKAPSQNWEQERACTDTHYTPWRRRLKEVTANICENQFWDRWVCCRQQADRPPGSVPSHASPWRQLRARGHNAMPPPTSSPN